MGYDNLNKAFWLPFRKTDGQGYKIIKNMATDNFPRKAQHSKPENFGEEISIKIYIIIFHFKKFSGLLKKAHNSFVILEEVALAGGTLLIHILGSLL